jgi:nucleotide-binding universal stress UspA family protein
MFGVLVLLTIYYYARIGFQSYKEAHTRSLSPGRWRLMVPFYNTSGLDGVMKLGTVLAEAEQDLNMCLLSVIPKNAQVDEEMNGKFIEKIRQRRKFILEKFIHYAVERNVPLYTKMVADESLAKGIINEIKNDNNVKLLLLKWPDDTFARDIYVKAIKEVVDEHIVNIGVLYDRGIKSFENIMVPVSGGYHSRLAVRLANKIATQENGNVEYLRIIPEDADEEAVEDQMANLQEIVMTELNQIPNNASIEVVKSNDVAQMLIDESRSGDYDLIIIGSSEETLTPGSIFGYKVDSVTEKATCSVLVIHHLESPAASWLRRQIKQI